MIELFKELQKKGEAAIDSWIGERKGENLNFDCKKKKDASKPELEGNDRKNLGKALSAFANSDGGLLLWGVDARNKDGVDCLIGKEPIAQIGAFRSQVEHAVADLINPPIPGLETHEIPCSEDTGAGYLAISIPCSERRPHMSRANSEPGFFFRNGHQSILMEVSQIRDQMLRRVVPQLEFDWDARVLYDRLSPINTDRPSITVSVDLLLKNNSAVSARFPYLMVRVDRSRYAGMGSKYHEFFEAGFPVLPIGPIGRRSIVVDAYSVSLDWEFAGGADCCIHPGTALRIAAVELQALASITTKVRPQNPYYEFTPIYSELPTVFMEVSYGCLDASCAKISLELDAEIIHAKLYSNGRAGVINVPL